MKIPFLFIHISSDISEKLKTTFQGVHSIVVQYLMQIQLMTINKKKYLLIYLLLIVTIRY